MAHWPNLVQDNLQWERQHEYSSWPENVQRNYAPENKAPCFIDIFLEPCLDLVIGQERHIAGMGDRQDLPIPQQSTPRLEQSVRANEVVRNER